MFVFKAMRSFWMILEALESTTACAKVTFFEHFFCRNASFLARIVVKTVDSKIPLLIQVRTLSRSALLSSVILGLQ